VHLFPHHLSSTVSTIRNANEYILVVVRMGEIPLIPFPDHFTSCLPCELQQQILKLISRPSYRFGVSYTPKYALSPRTRDLKQLSLVSRHMRAQCVLAGLFTTITLPYEYESFKTSLSFRGWLQSRRSHDIATSIKVLEICDNIFYEQPSLLSDILQLLPELSRIRYFNYDFLFREDSRRLQELCPSLYSTFVCGKYLQNLEEVIFDMGYFTWQSVLDMLQIIPNLDLVELSLSDMTREPRTFKLQFHVQQRRSKPVALSMRSYQDYFLRNFGKYFLEIDFLHFEYMPSSFSTCQSYFPNLRTLHFRYPVCNRDSSTGSIPSVPNLVWDPHAGGLGPLDYYFSMQVIFSPRIRLICQNYPPFMYQCRNFILIGNEQFPGDDLACWLRVLLSFEHNRFLGVAQNALIILTGSSVYGFRRSDNHAMSKIGSVDDDSNDDLASITGGLVSIDRKDILTILEDASIDRWPNCWLEYDSNQDWILRRSSKIPMN